MHLKLLTTVCKGWVAEYRFHGTRKWRFDFAHPGRRIAVEIEGGIFARGRLGHSTGVGIKKDMKKYNEAALLGWTVLRYMPEQTGEMLRDVERMVRKRVDIRV